MAKILINRLFSFILSAYFASLYILTNNVLFMFYSITTVAIFLIINHFLQINETQRTIDKILNYVFFYLDESAQAQLFSRNRHSQIIDLINIWFLVEMYSKQRFNKKFITEWKLINKKLINDEKQHYIKNFLVKNQENLKDSLSLVNGKQKFIGYLMKNLKEEQNYQEIFLALEQELKENSNFLIKLNDNISELPEEFDSKELDLKKLFNKTLNI